MGRTRRRMLLLIACCGVGVLVAVAVAVSATRHSGARPTRVALRILQFNLCDSGIAGCYTGRSVARAAAVIRSAHPDVVTLNEVCRDDVSELARSMAGAETGFRPAVDRRTHRPVLCRDGQEYGDGVVASGGSSSAGYGGVYPIQDPDDVERRVWLCIHADVYACTTHLSSTSPTVAFAQCRYLLRTAIPALQADAGTDPVVLAGDLNLATGGSPDARSCVPAGAAHADDGARQHVIASGYRVTSRTVVDMQRTTDHPALLIDLADRGRDPEDR